MMLTSNPEPTGLVDPVRRFSRPVVLWETNGQWAGRIRQIDPLLGQALESVDGPSACWHAAVKQLPAVVLVEFSTTEIHSQLKLVWNMRTFAPALLIVGLADRRWRPLEIPLRELGPQQIAFRSVDLLPLASMIYRWERQFARASADRASGGADRAALLR